MESNNLKYCGLQDLPNQELAVIEGGFMVPWGLIGRVVLRVGAGAAGIATGAAIVVGVGLLAYEIYDALSD